MNLLQDFLQEKTSTPDVGIAIESTAIEMDNIISQTNAVFKELWGLGYMMCSKKAHMAGCIDFSTPTPIPPSVMRSSRSRLKKICAWVKETKKAGTGKFKLLILFFGAN